MIFLCKLNIFGLRTHSQIKQVIWGGHCDLGNCNGQSSDILQTKWFICRFINNENDCWRQPSMQHKWTKTSYSYYWKYPGLDNSIMSVASAVLIEIHGTTNQTQAHLAHIIWYVDTRWTCRSWSGVRWEHGTSDTKIALIGSCPHLKNKHVPWWHTSSSLFWLSVNETADDRAGAQWCICAEDVSSFVGVLLVNWWLHGMGYQSYEKVRNREGRD